MKYALPVALLLCGCLFSKDRPDSDEPKRPFLNYAVVKDSVSQDERFLILINGFPMGGYCIEDSLVEQNPRIAQKYRLSGDTLSFWFLTNFEDSALEVHDVYVRPKPAGTLAGNWRRIKSELVNPNHATVPEYMQKDLIRRDSAYRNESMVIREDSLLLYYERTAEMRVWDLIADLPASITYSFHGQDLTKFKKNGTAVVTFQTDPDNILRISSSNPQDKEYVIYSKPTKCPADTTVPAWYNDFFEIKPEDGPAPKRSAALSASAGGRGF
jgi:hypothetical protein